MDYHDFIKDLMYFSDNIVSIRYYADHDYWKVTCKSTHITGLTSHYYGIRF